MKIAIIALLAALTLGACATLGDNQRAIQMSVQYATLKYIGEDTDKAKRVHQVAQEVIPGLSGATTVGALESALRQKIRWERLDMADRLLLDTLITELANELHERMGDGVLDAEQRARVETIVYWVQQAARLAGAE